MREYLAPIKWDIHLSAELETPQRLDLLQRAQWWIDYKEARDVLHRLEQIMRYGPGRVRPPNILLVSPSNNGKSMLIEKFRRDHTPEPTEGTDVENLPIIVLQMPTRPTFNRFYAELLAELGAPHSRWFRSQDMERVALKTLRAVSARILIIDELHNMLAGSGTARREFLNVLRYLGNTLRIPIVGAGTHEAYLAIRTDAQLENRFEPIILPLWEPGTEAATLMMSFATSLPLRRASYDLLRGDVIRAIISRTGGHIGEILALLRAAAIIAIETGEEEINDRALRTAHYKGPLERRTIIERRLSGVL